MEKAPDEDQSFFGALYRPLIWADVYFVGSSFWGPDEIYYWSLFKPPPPVAPPLPW